MTSFVGPIQVKLFKLLTLRSAILLAAKGIRANRHISVWQVMKRDFGYKGRKIAVALAIVEEAIKEQEELVRLELAQPEGSA